MLLSSREATTTAKTLVADVATTEGDREEMTESRVKRRKSPFAD